MQPSGTRTPGVVDEAGAAVAGVALQHEQRSLGRALREVRRQSLHPRRTQRSASSTLRRARFHKTGGVVNFAGPFPMVVMLENVSWDPPKKDMSPHNYPGQRSGGAVKDISTRGPTAGRWQRH